MRLQRSTIQELGEIVQQEFDTKLTKDDLDKLAYSLIGYFGILLKAKTRENKAKFGNSSAVRIDNKTQKKENDKAKQ